MITVTKGQWFPLTIGNISYGGAAFDLQGATEVSASLVSTLGVKSPLNFEISAFNEISAVCDGSLSAGKYGIEVSCKGADGKAYRMKSPGAIIEVSSSTTSSTGSTSVRVAGDEWELTADVEMHEGQARTYMSLLEEVRQGAVKATEEATDATNAINEAKAACEEQTTKAEKTNSDITAAESARVEAENGRVKAESERVTTENARVAAENKREQSEQSRESSETGRVNAEKARVAAETARAAAEAQRKDAEIQRETAFTSAKGACETATKDATAATDKANTATANANSATEAATKAEQARVTAETDRVKAEQGRVTAENSRDTAEAKRASAETERQSAEDARKAAEQKRESAFGLSKSAADTATDKANTATKNANDATALAHTATTAANNASSDAQTAESQRADAEKQRAAAEQQRAATFQKLADGNAATIAEMQRIAASISNAQGAVRMSSVPASICVEADFTAVTGGTVNVSPTFFVPRGCNGSVMYHVVSGNATAHLNGEVNLPSEACDVCVEVIPALNNMAGKVVTIHVTAPTPLLDLSGEEITDERGEAITA